MSRNELDQLVATESGDLCGSDLFDPVLGADLVSDLGHQFRGIRDRSPNSVGQCSGGQSAGGGENRVCALRSNRGVHRCIDPEQ